jgi:hypothetical protein
MKIFVLKGFTPYTEGDITAVDDSYAKELIKGGYAEKYVEPKTEKKDQKKETKKDEKPETKESEKPEGTGAEEGKGEGSSEAKE